MRHLKNMVSEQDKSILAIRAPALRSATNFVLDKSGTDLQIRDYRGYNFTVNNLPSSLEGYVLDRSGLQSLLTLADKGVKISFRRAVFYQTDFRDLNLEGFDFSRAKFFDCQLADFTKCDLKGAIVNSDCSKAKFTNCVLRFADFTGASNLDVAQISTNRDWQEARFSEQVLLQVEPVKKHTVVKSKTFTGLIRNLFGDDVEEFPSQTKSSRIPQEVVTGITAKANADINVDKFVDKARNITAGEIADNLQQKFAEQGNKKFQERLAKERIQRGKEAEAQLRGRAW